MRVYVFRQAVENAARAAAGFLLGAAACVLASIWIGAGIAGIGLYPQGGLDPGLALEAFGYGSVLVIVLYGFPLLLVSLAARERPWLAIGQLAGFCAAVGVSWWLEGSGFLADGGLRVAFPLAR